MLKKLHRVNQRKYQVSENIFTIDEFSDWFNFYGEAYRSSWKTNLGTSADAQYCVMFSHFPLVFNILLKIKLLFSDSLLKLQERKIKACMSLAGIL
jgi:hypothetical protein